MPEKQELIQRLREEQNLPREALLRLLEEPWSEEDAQALYAAARAVKERAYGREVYLRGLIEYTNYCRNDCYYCGLRRSNRNCERYRLTDAEIFACCEQGYALGFRTFVLQGGEDAFQTDERLCTLIRELRRRWPDCALTLSIGERSRESYRALHEAGADRYLLRQETSNPAHYRRLHPAELTIENRKRCLRDLKELGFQVGCGIMVGSPGQTAEDVVEDLVYMKAFRPHMVGIGPFVPHHDTPFRDEPAGGLDETLRLLAIVRLMLPEVLLPSTTALGTIHPRGREMGIEAGANVVMPNLTPGNVRKKYLLYDGKPGVADEAATQTRALIARMEAIGCTVPVSRGDPKGNQPTGQV